MAEHGNASPRFCIVGATKQTTSPSEAEPVPASALWRLAEQAGWQCRYVDACAGDEMDESVALVELKDAGIDSARRQFPHALIVSAREDACADLVLPSIAAHTAMKTLLNHGENHWRRNLKVMSLFREVGARRQRLTQLADIGRSLSTQRDFAQLLEAILSEARVLAGCEAGSLYLVDRTQDEPALAFMLAQNDRVDVPFMQQRIPLTSASIAGHVALTGNELDIPDVYDLPADTPYEFNGSFDEQMSYRSRSMLVLPMRDHRDQVVGVLQFINRLEPTSDVPVAFGEEISELLKAIASQAAVSIQKNQLISDIHRLFESFVQASVKAIEQRDPSTSGHSFRVAETTVALMQDLPKSSFSRFHNLSFSQEHLREVRYAALLHDFGKVGVKENVLLKANKLTDDRLEILHYRVELQKERLRRRAVEQQLDLLHHGPVDIEVARRRIHRQLDAQLSQLDDFFQLISRANVPNVRDDGDFEHLRSIRDYAFREIDGTINGLITDADLMALSVRRGSLTPEERREIQSHVSYTRDFLAVLPWPPELANVPAIAGAHHEKLDGSGYPLGLVGDQIPLASKVMTVCDIYDALTSMDRPYKKSMSVEVALSILDDEARQGLLDEDIVQVFKESRIYQRGPTDIVSTAS